MLTPRARSAAVARRSRVILVGCGLLACAIGLGGCSRELFSGDPFRSQYDRYDQSQSQLASDSVIDAYGRKRPNLRARLQPRD